MRAFLDGILAFILCATLSDAEWATISTLTDQSITLANYNALLGILTARESVSSARDRLRFYFQAGGLVGIDPVPAKKSNIYVGDSLQ